MTGFLSDIEERARLIVSDQDEDRWPRTKKVLAGLARAYGLGVRLRAKGYASGLMPVKRLPCPVIAVGNLTVGGTGKTPVAIYLATLIKRLGYRPAIISRGYKGHAEDAGGIVTDGRQILMDVNEAGDEPVMMAAAISGVPVLVGSDRFRSGLMACRSFRPDVIICDDAFQHIRLARQLNIVLMDHTRPLGNGWVLPRGSLREPPSALERADLLVMTRFNPNAVKVPDVVTSNTESLPTFFTRHAPYFVRLVPSKGTVPSQAQADLAQLAGRRCYGFSGIADNRDFERTLSGAGCLLTGFASYPDHHAYSNEQIEMICSAAEKSGAEMVVTTEKDYMRIANRLPLPLDVAVVGIRIQFVEGEQRFEAQIRKVLPPLHEKESESA